MPAAIFTAVATWAATITVTQVVLFAASFAISTAMASRAQKKADAQQRAAADAQRAAYNSGLVDRTQVVRSAIRPRNIILGRDEASGPLACWFTYGPKRNFHAFAVVLAGHECDAVETVMFNHEPVTLASDGAVIAPAKYTRVRSYANTVRLPGNVAGTVYNLPEVPTRVDAVVSWFTPMGYTITGNQVTLLQDAIKPPSDEEPTFDDVAITYTVTRLEPLFYVKAYLGAPGQQAAPELVAAAAAAGVPNSWNERRKGTSVCYLSVICEADFNVLGQIGMPNVSAVTRGAKCYDRRTGLTQWTHNPALQAEWFTVYSGYAPKTLPSEINDLELKSSANVSDEGLQISASLYSARYTSHGQLTTAASPMDNLSHILDAMDGDGVWIRGQWNFVAGYYKVPTLEINESTLSSAGIKIVPRTAKRDLFNAISGQFVNAAAGYVRTSYPMVTSAAYQAEDGDELLPAAANFELVNDPARCQMIAWQRLTRARQPLTVQLGTTLRGYDTAPLQNVTLNLRRPGYTDKVFTVLRRQFERNKLLYVLQETGPEVWAWDYTTAAAAVDIPNTSYPDVSTIPAISGVQIETGTAALLKTTAGPQSRARISWTQITNTFVADSGRIQWQHKNASVTSGDWVTLPPAMGSDTLIFSGALTDGDVMLFRGRCITGQGREGDWCPIQSVKIIGKTEDPTPPSRVAATPEFAIFTLSPDADIDGYEVRYSPGKVSNGSVATAVHQGLVAGSPWPMPLRLYGINTIFVRSVDDGGRKSVWVWDTQNFGVPDAANVANLVDFAALGFPGVVTNGSVVGGVLEADSDPATDIYGAGSGADIYYRDGAADIYGGSQYLALQYLVSYVSLYAGGAIFLEHTAAGSRTTIQYRVDGDPLGDVYSDADGDGDIYSGKVGIYGDEQNWRPWPGVHTPTMASQGLQFLLTIDAGSVQGALSEVALRTEMPTITQTFGRVMVDAGGTTLLPADGLPPLKFIQIEDVQITPIASAAGAISGRVKGEALPAGITVELINDLATPVTGPAFINISGF